MCGYDRQQSAADDGDRRRDSGRVAGDAVLLHRHQRRPAQPGDADRLHLAAVRGADGDHFRRGAVYLEDCPGDGDDRGRDRAADDRVTLDFISGFYSFGGRAFYNQSFHTGRLPPG